MPQIAERTQPGLTYVEGSNVRADMSWVWIVPGDPVEIYGEPKTTFFMQLRLEWNGGVNNPAVVSVSPPEFADVNFSVFADANTTNGWVIRYSHTTVVPSFSPVVSAIVSPTSAFDGIAFTGFSTGGPGNIYDFYGFVLTKGGTSVLPPDGDLCTITIPN